MKGVTIILCCYNSEGRVRPVLEHLAKLKKSQETGLELILVDNNSSDDTQGVAREEWGRQGTPFILNIVFEPKSGLIHARKAGVKNAKYDYILFVDDDNLLDANYLEAGIDILKERQDIGVLGGIGTGKFESQLPKWIDPGRPFKSLLNSLAISTNSNSKTGYLLEKDDFVFGASSFYKKDIFTRLEENSYQLHLTGRKGDELLSGEDQELCFLARMMGYKLYRSDRLKFTHVIPQGRISKAYFEKLYRGFGYSSVIISLYSQYVDQQSVELDTKMEYFKSKMKYLAFKMFYALFIIFPDRFFKFNLLGHFEKGKMAFLKDNENLDDIRNSILNIHEKIKLGGE